MVINGGSPGNNFTPILSTKKLKAKKNQKTTTIKITKKISASGYMKKIQSARSTSAVSNVVVEARKDLSIMRSNGATELEIKQARDIINHVVEKANTKMMRLKRESQLEREKCTAKHKEKEKIEKTIRRKRRARKAMEQLDTLDPREVDMNDRNKWRELDSLDADREVEQENYSLDVVSPSTEIATGESAVIDEIV